MKKTAQQFLYLFLLFLLSSCSFAQSDNLQDSDDLQNSAQTWQLDTKVEWLVSTTNKLYVLDAIGLVSEIDINANEVKAVAEATPQSFLTNCNNDVVFINANGNIETLNTDWQGPEVAPFSTMTCLASGEIIAVNNDGELLKVGTDGTVLNQLGLDALRDAKLSQADIDRDGNVEIVVLAGPATRYAHGVLGDRIEADSFFVVDGESFEVESVYAIPEPFVFEQRGVTILETEYKTYILATHSSRQTGAGVLAFEKKEVLRRVGEAGVIGLGNRWLNLFDSANGEAYAIKTPHIGGPLQRYSFVDGEFQVTSEDVGVTNHKIGSRNLDLAVLIPTINEVGFSLTTSFIAPQYDQKTLEAFSCPRAKTCESQWTYKMDNSLTSNLVTHLVADKTYVAAADQSGKVYLIATPSF